MEKEKVTKEKLLEEYTEYAERVIHGDSDEGVENLLDFRNWKQVYCGIYK